MYYLVCGLALLAAFTIATGAFVTFGSIVGVIASLVCGPVCVWWICAFTEVYYYD